MKKFLSVILIFATISLMFACSDSPVENAKSAIASADTIEELDELMEKDIDETIKILEDEFKKLSSELNTYDKYKNNVAKIEEFYAKIVNDTELLCIRLREYSVGYANLVISSDKEYKKLYDDIIIIKENVYEDACKTIEREIHDKLFKNMENAFYDGVIKDAKDSFSYDEYSDMRSDAYDMRSDARSNVYDIRSNARSDIYDFHSDLRGHLYDNNIEKAKNKIEKFKKSIEKMYNGISG